MAVDYELGDTSPLYNSILDRNLDMKEVFYAGVSYLQIPLEEEIRVSTADAVYEVKAGQIGRLDIVAQITYNEPKLWWFIAQANQIFNPFTEMYEGMKLRIPPLSSLPGR